MTLTGQMHSETLISSPNLFTPPELPLGLTQEQWHPFQATIAAYFSRFNSQDFTGLVDLFAPQGILHAPFESPIVGPKAIVQYLQAEATGMTAIPQSLMAETQSPEQILIKVQGTVQTSWFSVNVAWSFQLDSTAKIQSATIQLLASAQELLTLGRSPSAS